MPRKNNRPDARRDENEPEIIDHLRENGYHVERIGNPGDLIVTKPHSRYWVCLEVKMPDGRMTPSQKKYRKENPDIDIPVVRTGEAAVDEMEKRGLWRAL